LPFGFSAAVTSAASGPAEGCEARVRAAGLCGVEHGCCAGACAGVWRALLGAVGVAVRRAVGAAVVVLFRWWFEKAVVWTVSGLLC